MLSFLCSALSDREGSVFGVFASAEIHRSSGGFGQSFGFSESRQPEASESPS